MKPQPGDILLVGCYKRGFLQNLIDRFILFITLEILLKISIIFFKEPALIMISPSKKEPFVKISTNEIYQFGICNINNINRVKVVSTNRRLAYTFIIPLVTQQ